MDDDYPLAAQVSQPPYGPAVVRITNRAGRHDQLRPYWVTTESDVDDPGYKPGGQLYKTVDLVIPSSAHDHTNGVILSFSNVVDVVQLMAWLDRVKEELKQTFTPDHFAIQPAIDLEELNRA
jgi:hypothetical protein